MKRFLLLVLVLAFTTLSCNKRNYQPQEPKEPSNAFTFVTHPDRLSTWDLKEISDNVTILSERIEVVKEGVFTDEELANGVNVDELPMVTDFKYVFVYKDVIYTDIYTFHSVHKNFHEVIEYLQYLFDEKYPTPFKYNLRNRN